MACHRSHFFVLVFHFCNLGPVQTGRPPLGAGADGSRSLCASSTHARNRQWDPRPQNWVPICASIWDQNPRLGPALPGIAIWKWEVSAQPLVGLLTVAAWIDPPRRSVSSDTHTKRDLSQEAPQWMRNMFEELKDMFEGLFPDAEQVGSSANDVLEDWSALWSCSKD